MSCTRMPAFVMITNYTSANKPITIVKEVQLLHHSYRENDGVLEGNQPNPFLPLNFPKFELENGYPIDKNPE